MLPSAMTTENSLLLSSCSTSINPSRDAVVTASVVVSAVSAVDGGSATSVDATSVTLLLLPYRNASHSNW